MLVLERLGARPKGGKGKRAEPVGYPVAIVNDKTTNKPIGFLKVVEDGDGEELIEIPENLEFQLIPETRDNLVSINFITGGAGCGKSTIASQFMRNFDAMYDVEPQYKVIISSDDIDDPAFHGIEHMRICVDNEFALCPPTLEQLTNPNGFSYILFDDIEGITDPKKLKALESVVDSVLTMGRKRGIHCGFISHRSAGGKSTKMILVELNGIVWFPKLSSSRNLTYCLEKHIGVPAELRNYLKSSDWGRWVYLRTGSSPQILMGANRCCIYNHDDITQALKKKSIIDKKRNHIDAEEALGLR
jgi:hypothetical protein